MPLTDMCEAIAAVLHPQLVPAGGPLPPATAAQPGEDTGATTSPGVAPAAADTQILAEAADLPYTGIYASQAEEWTRIVRELAEVRSWGEDPLLHALESARRRRDQVDEDIRLLVALGREFVGPRPYEFAGLTRASGLTHYLVRKAYSGEHIAYIQQITGLEPRTPAADPHERAAEAASAR